MLRAVADATGLTSQVTAVLADTYRGPWVHEPGRVFADLACAVADGADCISGIGTKAELILTATREQRSLLLTREPRAPRRTFTVLEFAQASVQVRERWPCISDPAEVVMLAAAARSRVSLDGYDVADPYGGSADQHRIAAELTLAAVATIAAGLTPK